MQLARKQHAHFLFVPKARGVRRFSFGLKPARDSAPESRQSIRTASGLAARARGSSGTARLRFCATNPILEMLHFPHELTQKDRPPSATEPLPALPQGNTDF